MTDLQIGDKTELGMVLMKIETMYGEVPVFSNENRFNEKCKDLVEAESLPHSYMINKNENCFEKLEIVIDRYGNRIENDEIFHCIIHEAEPEEFDEVVLRILNFEDLFHREATIGDVKKIIKKVHEEYYSNKKYQN